jgi:HD superfamily phosphohydrolase YqeK
MTAKEHFLEIYDKYITRPGATELRVWLLASDFFTAPASTKYHNDHEGGLCEHSINVFNQMIRLLRAYPEIQTKGETVAIISLLHDMCKIDCYKVDYKNAKNEAGQWERVPYYAWDEKFPYGNHGAKSVYLIERFIRLTDTEAIAIQCHMGNEDGRYGVSESYRQYPLAWLLHVADEAASYMDEKEE